MARASSQKPDLPTSTTSIPRWFIGLDTVIGSRRPKATSPTPYVRTYLAYLEPTDVH